MTAQRPPLRVLVAVGLIAGATLALQVLLTRLFAAVLFYHFGFLAISLALLGVGAAGIAVYLKPEWFDRVGLERGMARSSLAFAVLVPVALFILVRLNYLYTGVSLRFVLNLGVACVVAALPLFAGGLAIALAIRGYTRSVGRVYGFDLAGAGLGAAAVVPLMWLVDVPTLIASLALAGALAALLFAAGPGRERVTSLAVGGVAAGLIALSAATSLFYLPIGGPKPQADRWTPISRITAFTFPGAEKGTIIYDRVVGEMLRYQGGPYPTWRETQEGPESIGYGLNPSSGKALIIGGGGGRDIMTALGSGYRDIDVIELNRGIREMVDEDLGSFSGRPYSQPGVSVAYGDGRSVLAQRDTRYDQIQLGFTDTFSANSAHAFALTENNLYTREAFEEYFDHLKPNGILKVSRPVRHSGQEALRTTVLALDALDRRGVENPEDHVVVLLGDYQAPFKFFRYGTVLVKRTPFTQAQLEQIRRQADARGGGVVMMPGGPNRGPWAELAAAPSITEFCSNYPVNVCPPTDDKPFFFHQKRLSDLGGASTAATIGVPDPMVMLLITLGLLGTLCLVAFVLPLALVRGRERPTIGSLSFFAAIGVGFLVAEVVLIQRFVLFLGFPTYALSVVLCVLLVASGLGALLTTRAGFGDRRALLVALSAACLMLLVGAFALQPLLRALIELPFGARLAVSVALLTPLGLVLGMAMPIGLRRLAALFRDGTPWAWGINGVTSVLASVLAIAVALNAGFAVTTLVALACYLGALAHAAFGRWPTQAELEAARPADDEAPPERAEREPAPEPAPA